MPAGKGWPRSSGECTREARRADRADKPHSKETKSSAISGNLIRRGRPPCAQAGGGRALQLRPPEHRSRAQSSAEVRNPFPGAFLRRLTRLQPRDRIDDGDRFGPLLSPLQKRSRSLDDSEDSASKLNLYSAWATRVSMLGYNMDGPPIAYFVHVRHERKVTLQWQMHRAGGATSNCMRIRGCRSDPLRFTPAHANSVRQESIHGMPIT